MVSFSILVIVAILLFFLEFPNFAYMDLIYYYLFLCAGAFLAPIIIVTSGISIAISKKKLQILLLCMSAVWFLVTIYLFETRVITL